VGARHRPLLVPTARLIKVPDAFEQPVRGRVDVHRQDRYLLTHFLDGEHADKLNICSVHRQAENDRISAIFLDDFRGA
jgi:hypothetical protein